MNILILGSGGRECAFAWKFAQSEKTNRIFIAPGNAGTDEIGTNIAINLNDFEAIKNEVIKNNINLVIVGPEDPLVNGVHDFFLADENYKDGLVGGGTSRHWILAGSFVYSGNDTPPTTDLVHNKLYSKTP